MPARRMPTRLDRIEVVKAVAPYLYLGKNKGCWLWVNGAGNAERYPQRMINGKYYRIAALLLWSLGYTKDVLVGDRAVMLCHTCDNGEIGCVRPSHVFVGDQTANMRDSLLKGRNPNSTKRFCKNGHDLNDPLVGRRYGDNLSHRHCLACKRESERRKRGIPVSRQNGPTVEKMAITREQLIAAVNACDGRLMQAGDLLGIGKSSVYRKWYQFGLS